MVLDGNDEEVHEVHDVGISVVRNYTYPYTLDSIVEVEHRTHICIVFYIRNTNLDYSPNSVFHLIASDDMGTIVGKTSKQNYNVLNNDDY